MNVLVLPYDCIDEISSFLNIIGYINWKNTSTYLKNILTIDNLKNIYNGPFNQTRHATQQYFGDVRLNKTLKTNFNGLIRHGFGIYTKYPCKNKTIKIIGYWKNNDISVSKIITINHKTNEEKWEVKNKIYNNKIDNDNPTDQRHKGEWRNGKKNGIGCLELTSIYKHIKIYGTWTYNIKNGCFNEIYYNSEKNNSLWYKFIDINYYKNNILSNIQFKLTDNIINIIDKNKDFIKTFHLTDNFSIYTVCAHINNLIAYYVTTNTSRKPLCIISKATDKNKICNCELCNYIIKHKKYYLSLIT
jgi:hypothetical protein